MLKLKLQYFGHLMGRANSLEKILKLSKTEGSSRRGWQRTRLLYIITDLMEMGLSKLQEMVKDKKNLVCFSPWGHKESDMNELNWTELIFGSMEVKSAQSCPTLCNPMNYTVHGILQARILEWVAISFSRASSWPRDQIQVSRIAGRRFHLWARETACNAICPPGGALST